MTKQYTIQDIAISLAWIRKKLKEYQTLLVSREDLNNQIITELFYANSIPPVSTAYPPMGIAGHIVLNMGLSQLSTSDDYTNNACYQYLTISHVPHFIETFHIQSITLAGHWLMSYYQDAIPRSLFHESPLYDYI